MSVINDCIIVTGPIPPTTAWTAKNKDEKVQTITTVATTLPVDASSTTPKPLHRLADVRRQEGLTRRVVSQRMGISPREVERQESPFTDILLSDLHRWQKALGVPLVELLCEPDCELSPPVQLKARLLLVMKTARAIQDRTRPGPLQRLAKMLVEQLAEIMPDLKETAPWPTVGRRREKRELGEAFFRRLSLDSLDELEGPEKP